MPRSPSRSAAGTLRPADFLQHLVEKAAEMAPEDLGTLVSHREQLSQEAERDAADHPLIKPRVELALAVIDDHIAGRCPQIPYQPITYLAAALFYYLDPVDVIPDFLPKVGTSDDALVLELAFRLAAPGVDRYLTWRGVDPSANLAALSANPGRAATPRAKVRRSPARQTARTSKARTAGGRPRGSGRARR